MARNNFKQIENGKERNMYTYDQVLEASTAYFEGDELAASVFAGKYALQDENGNYLEIDPGDMHKRLAREFARVEQKYPNSMTEDEIYALFKEFKYIVPQGSPMSGIGNNHQIQSISNCFVIAFLGSNIILTNIFGPSLERFLKEAHQYL